MGRVGPMVDMDDRQGRILPGKDRQLPGWLLSSQSEPECQRKRCKSHPAKRPKTHRKYPRTSLSHGMSFQFSVFSCRFGYSKWGVPGHCQEYRDRASSGCLRSLPSGKRRSVSSLSAEQATNFVYDYKDARGFVPIRLEYQSVSEAKCWAKVSFKMGGYGPIDVEEITQGID